MKSGVEKALSVIIILLILLTFQGKSWVKAENSIALTTFGSAYTQDFNTLAVSEESSSLPIGWVLKETGTNENTAYMPGAGKVNTPDTYSFGAKDSTDRALGMIQGDDFVPIIGASFTNSTGGVIQSLLITYTGEQWRAGKGGRQDKILFEFSTDATTLEDGHWTNYDNLMYLSNKSEKAEAKDGNNINFRQTLSETITGLTIEEGETFWIRWTDFNYKLGDDDGLAVDDFSITPIGLDNSPVVLSTTPTSSALDVEINADIEVNFSEPVNLETGWFSLDCSKSGQHTATVSGGLQFYTLQPVEDFINNETCTLTIVAEQVTDQDGNDPPDSMESNYTTSFTTLPLSDMAPHISSTNPSADETSVDLDSSIVVHFSEPVETASGWFDLECSISGSHPAEISGGPTIFTLTPANPFVYEETCKLSITALKINDLDGNESPDFMSENYSTTFSTLPTPDTAPFITDISPGNGQSGVDINQDIVITFNEQVYKQDGWFELICSQSGTHTAQVLSASASFTINPDQDFSYAEICSLTIKGEKISDLDLVDPPDLMMMNQTIAFSTAHQPDQPPVLIHSIPSVGSDNVAIDSNITLTFSEPVITTGEWFELNCSTSGAHSVSISGDSQVLVLDPDKNYAYGELCSLSLTSALISDSDTDDPPDQMEENQIITFSVIILQDLSPEVTATIPSDNALDVPISGDLKVSFSEPVHLDNGWVDVQCSKSGNHIVFLSGGPVAYSFGSDRNFVYDEKCIVKFTAQEITDLDTLDPPDSLSADYTFSFTTLPDPASLVFPVVVTDGNTHPSDGEVLQSSLKVLKVQFSKEVLHDGSEDAADNPDNYRLLSIGANRLFETETCDTVIGDDIQISIDRVDYDELTNEAELHVNQGTDLASGIYRLIVCGAHTIRDLDGNAINDGMNTMITFTVAQQPSAGGSGGDENDSAESPKETVKTGVFIPVTGFTPDRITLLPRQTTAYSETDDLWLEIPSMELEIPIVGVPQDNGLWDVTWLEEQAGWLEGSAFPTFAGNSVLTAHVWDANNQPGPFYGLEKLRFGDQVIVHAWGEEYVYEVREVKVVAPDNVDAMMKHQENPWLTLVTCQGFDEESGEYQKRILVRAVLVEIMD